MEMSKLISVNSQVAVIGQSGICHVGDLSCKSHEQSGSHSHIK